MKRIFLFIIVVFVVNISTMAQESGDRAEIIQMCLDIPEIQKLFPKDAKDKFIPVHIMQYPIVLQTDIDILKFGQRPVFMSREQIYDNQIDTYFLFQNLDIIEGSAFAKFTLYHHQTSVEQKLWVVDLDIDKLNDKWVVVNTVIEKH